jgi:hypothetical protein
VTGDELFACSSQFSLYDLSTSFVHSKTTIERMASSSEPADETRETMKEANDRTGVEDALINQPVVHVMEEHLEDSLQPYVKSGFRGIITSPYVAGAAVLSTVGGLLFGTYTQAILPKRHERGSSVSLLVPLILRNLPRIIVLTAFRL